MTSPNSDSESVRISPAQQSTRKKTLQQPTSATSEDLEFDIDKARRTAEQKTDDEIDKALEQIISSRFEQR